MLSPNLRTDAIDAVRSSDAELIRLLRDGEALTIDELKRGMGVTATAVRQRIERLLESGLIERQKEVVGRGRPVFRYALTVDGHRHAGADSSEFAEAMWREIMALRDSPIRRRLISAIARRLGKMYAARLAENNHGDSEDDVGQRPLEQRMRSLSRILLRNQISAGVHVTGSKSALLPVLDIGACPYPTLRDTPHDRSLCKMEEEMLSEALGEPVHLTSCKLDGDHCCQFTPVTVGSQE
jgi:predicted ArsR family transcriptional regulator